MQGRKIQMSTWIIGGRFGGMAFRESKDHKFSDGSPFLPHTFKTDQRFKTK
jgi:glutathionylspermidine synthase